MRTVWLFFALYCTPFTGLKWAGLSCKKVISVHQSECNYTVFDSAKAKTREDQSQVIFSWVGLFSFSNCRWAVVMITHWHCVKLWCDSFSPPVFHLYWLVLKLLPASNVIVQSPSGWTDSRWWTRGERETLQRAEAVRSRKESWVVGLGPARHTRHWWASTAHLQYQVRARRFSSHYRPNCC